MTRDSFVHLMVENQAFRLPPGLERVTSPVLVVVGEKEYAAMQASGRDLLKAIPNATGRIVTLGKKSSMAKEHNWGMNAPDLFNRTVRAWLTGQPLPPELLLLQV